jgi:hypothetical protein
MTGDEFSHHVGKQIKCSRCGSLLPIFEGVTTVLQRPALCRAPRSVCKAQTSRLAQKNKMQVQLLHNLLHGATASHKPTSRARKDSHLGEDAFPKLARHWPEGLRVAMSDTCSKSG